MAVGLEVTQAEINQRSGSIARSVFSVMRDVLQFKAWLDTVTAAELQSIYGYGAGEATLLKAAYADLGSLAAEWAGGAPKTEPYDYRQFARRLIGTGVF